jgi:hypothetical protein
MEKSKLLEIIEAHLRENITETVYYSAIGDDKPSKGEIVLAYVFAGRVYEFDNQFARVVQIRLGCGQFGSDMYFLRLPTGELITAENQSYRKIPSEYLELVESHFSTDINYENDGFEEGFTIGGEQLEVGFIVDGKRTKGTPEESFSITITQ